MAPRVEHELHRRRRSRNVGLGLVLVAFIAIVFGLSIVKVKQGGLLQGYDHRMSQLPVAAPAAEKDIKP